MNNLYREPDKRSFFTSRAFALILILASAILLLSLFFGESGVLALLKLRKQIDALHTDVQKLKEERDHLKAEIDDLKKNPLALEKKARQDLWLMKKNEKVVVIIRDETKEQKTPPNSGENLKKNPKEKKHP